VNIEFVKETTNSRDPKKNMDLIELKLKCSPGLQVLNTQKKIVLNKELPTCRKTILQTPNPESAIYIDVTPESIYDEIFTLNRTLKFKLLANKASCTSPSELNINVKDSTRVICISLGCP